MPRPKSKAIEDPWFKLLQAEHDAKKRTEFTAAHRSIQQLRALRKTAKLPHGVSSTYAWVNELKKAGKIRQDDGVEFRNGRMVRATKYIFL
jgi:hypothetical protein